MATRKFKIAFSTIGTLPFALFVRMVITYRVFPRYYARCFLAGLISLFSEPFRWLEKIVFSGKLSRTALPTSPIFILGHWRSGTTLLHNTMTKDEQFAYINTYQSVFTNQFFGSRWLFKSLMRLLIPEKRPADNVLLSPDFPQEEGIALCNANSFAFYSFFYFPQQWKSFYLRFIRGESVSTDQLNAYGKRYKQVIAQALLEHDKNEFISKNPPNTGRIRYLLDMFPDAKFIYIYRNPLMVYQSTVNFFETTLEPLKLQPFSRADFEEMVFELYEWIIRDYEQQKALIPAQNLVEVRYEDFENDPFEGLRHIYASLGLEGFERSMPAFAIYLESQKKFEKAHRSFSREEMERISSRLEFSLKLYGYAVPVESPAAL